MHIHTYDYNRRVESLFVRFSVARLQRIEAQRNEKNLGNRPKKSVSQKELKSCSRLDIRQLEGSSYSEPPPPPSAVIPSNVQSSESRSLLFGP